MSIVDKAKEKAKELVDKVKDKLDGQSGETDAVRGDTSSETPAVDSHRTIPTDGAVTPADIAETMSDPDLPHPRSDNEPPAR